MLWLLKQWGVRGPQQRGRVCVQQKELEVEIDKVEGRAKAVRKIRSQMDKVEVQTEEAEEEGPGDADADQGKDCPVFAEVL